MAAVQNVDNIQFRVETLVVHNGHKLGRLRPDENGYYAHVPMAVLGIQTRNNTYYDVPAFVAQINNPSSMFSQRLAGGQLYGEWGHPNIIGLGDMEAMARLSDIREENYSHFFRGVNTGQKLEGGGLILEATIKPHGPFKQSLLDNLDDPCMNTAFSLRAITRAEQRGGVSFRTMRKLVTFDAVGAGGYFQASKAFSPATENFDMFDVSLIDVDTATLSQVALENFTDTELNDIFKSNHIQRHSQVVTVVKNQEAHSGKFSRFTQKIMSTMYHDHFKE